LIPKASGRDREKANSNPAVHPRNPQEAFSSSKSNLPLLCPSPQNTIIGYQTPTATYKHPIYLILVTDIT
jgi:hypothetical protein